MALKERQKLWFLGLSIAGIIGITLSSLKKISNFIDQFSFTPTVTGIDIVDSNIIKFPPVLGNLRVKLNIAIANPLNSSHAITDLSVRIFDKTNGNTQIGYSSPIAQKIVIPAASTTNVRDVQMIIPVSSIYQSLNVDVIKNIIATRNFRLNRTYDLVVHLRLDGIAGNTTTTITI